MKPSLKMTNGYYCVLSLRATTIILASINLLISVLALSVSQIILYRDVATPDRALHDDFDLDLPDVSTQSPTDPSVLKEEEDYHLYIVMSIIKDAINSILSLIDIILSIVLIYGACRAAFIRPWLFLGAAMIIWDFIYIIIDLAMGVHFSFAFDTMLHIPMVGYMWIVSWNLFEDCRDAAKKTGRSNMSMSALTANGPEDAEDNPCSVPYSAFDKA